MARLVGLASSDKATAWQSAGFTLCEDPVPSFLRALGCSAWLRIPTQSMQMAIGIGARDNSEKVVENGLVAWFWSGIPKPHGDSIRIGEIKTILVSEDEVARSMGSDMAHDIHANGLVRIDQVVVHTSNLRSVLSSFVDVGVKVLRKRSDLFAGTTQAFLRPSDDVIIEVAAPDEDAPDQRVVKHFAKHAKLTHLWGFTLVTNDMNATVAALSPNVGEIIKAKQPGRFIAHVKHQAFGLRTPIPIMSQHIKINRGTEIEAPPRSRTTLSNTSRI